MLLNPTDGSAPQRPHVGRVVRRVVVHVDAVEVIRVGDSKDEIQQGLLSVDFLPCGRASLGEDAASVGESVSDGSVLEGSDDAVE